MRRIGQPVDVIPSADGRPKAIVLSGVQRPVSRILDTWVEAGRWWEGEEPRRFYRVDAGGIFDLSYDSLHQWRVEVIWD